MSDIKIRVGAVGDASLETVFAPLEAKAKRARAQVEAEVAKAGKAIGDNIKKGAETAGTAVGTTLPAKVKQGTDKAEKEYAKLAREAEKWHKQIVKDAEKALREEVKYTEKATADRVKAEERAAREITRINERAAKDQERTANRISRAKERDNAQIASLAKGAASGASRVVGRIGSAALGAGTRLGGDLVRGIGVETSVAGMFSQGASLEKRATDLSNAGYMSGEAGPNGQRQDPHAIVDQMRAVATASAMDPEKAMEGLQKFVAKTGDLQTGRDVMAEMAKLSRASGASMEDMVDAAGDVSNGLGDVPNKAEKIKEVMAAMAGQGKLGAVEIKDLATQMAKLQAAAGMITGSSTRNMSDMGVLTQMARAKGGASSATQAATSVGSFMSTFDKGARLDKFDKYGVKVKADDGMNRRGIDIIKDALAATGGDDRKMSEMFASEGTKKVTRGWTKTYREAGGGKAGLEAVTAEFEKLSAATMNQTEVNDSFAASMNTTEAKVQVFNNQMAATADEVRSNLMPALVSLAPMITSAAQGIAEVVGKITGKTEQDDDAKARTNSLNAQYDRGTLNRGVDDGRVQAKDVKKGDEDLAALDASIAKKKKRNESHEMTPFSKAALIAQGGGSIVEANDKRVAEEKASLASDMKERERLATLLHDIKTGTLRVHIVNTADIKPAAATALPSANPHATLPAPTVVHE
jgi:hypothetical protein